MPTGCGRSRSGSGSTAAHGGEHEAVVAQKRAGQRARKRVIPRQRICQSRFSGFTTWKRSVSTAFLARARLSARPGLSCLSSPRPTIASRFYLRYLHIDGNRGTRADNFHREKREKNPIPSFLILNLNGRPPHKSV